ncbi:hypothetical protein TNCV_436551 [Trichonephila clavipes]|nr:hypothetical protein TNCV_436551 [Trichonephila clavipes]
MLGSQCRPFTHLRRRFSPTGPVIVTRFFFHVRLLERYGSAVFFRGRQCTMSSHGSCRTALRSEDIERMDWPARSQDLNPIEHV